MLVLVMFEEALVINEFKTSNNVLLHLSELNNVHPCYFLAIVIFSLGCCFKFPSPFQIPSFLFQIHTSSKGFSYDWAFREIKTTKGQIWAKKKKNQQISFQIILHCFCEWMSRSNSFWIHTTYESKKNEVSCVVQPIFF